MKGISGTGRGSPRVAFYALGDVAGEDPDEEAASAVPSSRRAGCGQVISGDAARASSTKPDTTTTVSLPAGDQDGTWAWKS
jgi:hypothetical protein